VGPIISPVAERSIEMARLDHFPEPMRSHLADLPCPSFQTHPWADGPDLSKRRVALISTAGLHRRGDRPFESMTGDYRVIPGDVEAKDLVMMNNMPFVDAVCIVSTG
jgi:D-proline reductase (dithiol) PrdB